jgi:hypothetical protein
MAPQVVVATAASAGFGEATVVAESSCRRSVLHEAVAATALSTKVVCVLAEDPRQPANMRPGDGVAANVALRRFMRQRAAQANANPLSSPVSDHPRRGCPVIVCTVLQGSAQPDELAHYQLGSSSHRRSAP